MSEQPSSPSWPTSKGMYQAEALRAFAHDLVDRIKEFELPVREAMKAAGGDGLDAFAYCRMLQRRLEGKEREIERLRALINNPHTDDFLESVRTEAAHQRERWGVDQDAGKQDSDWFWLIGYLAGKALNKPEKQLHHIITTAAACLNWHANKIGASTSMRPGIVLPESLDNNTGEVS